MKILSDNKLIRPSGRSFDELRKIEFIPNFISHAEGSCFVKYGETHVLCTASVEERVPVFLKNSGKGWVTAELSKSDLRFFRKKFSIYLKENNYELDDTISEEVTLTNGMLPKGIYKLTQDITFDKEDADTPDALEGDEVQTFEDMSPSDNVLGVDIFSVIHIPTQSKIFVSAEDIKEVGIEDLEL